MAEAAASAGRSPAGWRRYPINLRSALGVLGDDARRNNTWVLGVAGVLAIASAYEVVHGKVVYALALALLPAVAWLLAHPAQGLPVGLALILSCGAVVSHVLQVAAFLAAIALLSARRIRPTFADYAVGVYVAVVVLGWLFQYDQPETRHVVTSGLTPVGFYLGARAVPRSKVRSLMAVVLFAGAVGALTVIYEFARGHPVFISPLVYQWNASAEGLFRPGGIFGNPPAAATGLSCVFFYGLAAVRGLRGRARALAVVCLWICVLAAGLTFTRAPLLAALGGLIGYLWLVRSPLLRPARVLAYVVTLAAVLVVALPSIESSTTFKDGVARPGTLTAREGYWSFAIPIATSSVHNLIFGIGTGVLETQALSNRAPIPSEVAKSPQVYDNSLHSQYVTTLVEQGVVGVVALAMLLLSGFVPAVRAARATGDAACAALAATVFVIAVVFSVDTAILDPTTFTLLLVTLAFAAKVRPRPEPGRADLGSAQFSANN